MSINRILHSYRQVWIFNESYYYFIISANCTHSLYYKPKCFNLSSLIFILNIQTGVFVELNVRMKEIWISSCRELTMMNCLMIRAQTCGMGCVSSTWDLIMLWDLIVWCCRKAVVSLMPASGSNRPRVCSNKAGGPWRLTCPCFQMEISYTHLNSTSSISGLVSASC